MQPTRRKRFLVLNNSAWLTPFLLTTVLFSIAGSFSPSEHPLDNSNRQRRYASAQEPAFVPLCGYDDDDDYYDEPSKPPPAVWLGYSSNLFGGFFNITIDGSLVKPFGRCVASSSKFKLIERTDNGGSMVSRDNRCYRCMFIDRISPLVVKMRTTALQCLTTPNPDSSTLYKVCASLSPSLPLLTLLKIDNLLPSRCPFETGNYRVDYEYFGNSSPVTLDVSALVHTRCDFDKANSRACADRDGLHAYLASTNSKCDARNGQLTGALTITCLASWNQQQQSEASEHHKFAFIRLQVNDNTQSIRCAKYHRSRRSHHRLALPSSRHHQSHGFVIAIASGFDCSEISGLALRSSHGRLAKHRSAHILQFTLINSKTTTTTTTTHTPSTVMPLLPPGIKRLDEEGETTPLPCQLPSYLQTARNWHSIDGRSYHIVLTSPSTLTVYIGSRKNRKFIHLSCAEPEIWDVSLVSSEKHHSSRIYQAVFQVRLNNPTTDSSHRPRRSADDDFKCSTVDGVVFNVTRAKTTVEAKTAKRSRRQLNEFRLNSNKNTKVEKTSSSHKTFRCVKFYKRDQHVVEFVLSSPSSGPTSAACDDKNAKEEHRVFLIDAGVFMGYSTSECLSISHPGARQQFHQIATTTTPSAVDVIGKACLDRLCNTIASPAIADNDELGLWQSPTYLVFRQGSTCSSSTELYYSIKRCSYRWRRDYVSDHLVFSPISNTQNDERLSPLSCFILQHNGIHSAVSRLIPNKNCWLNSQINYTSISNTNARSLHSAFDSFQGFIFNAQEACHWEIQQPKFVNSNSFNNATPVHSVNAMSSRDTSLQGAGGDYYDNSQPIWRRLSANKSSSANSLTTKLKSLLKFYLIILVFSN